MSIVNSEFSIINCQRPYAFAVGSLSEWDLERTWNGIRTEVQRTYILQEKKGQIGKTQDKKHRYNFQRKIWMYKKDFVLLHT